jgi:hypothetical protein
MTTASPADTAALIYINLAGVRVMPGARPLLYNQIVEV